MDESQYKRLCAQPDVMRRDSIRATAALVRENHAALAARLSALLAASPVPKPAGHSGGPESDFFYLDLDAAGLDEVATALGDLEAKLAETGAPADQISLAATLLDRWSKADRSRPAV